MMPVRLHLRRLMLLLALFACHGDPMGPGAVRIVVEDGWHDAVVLGAPGEAVPDVSIRVLDDGGVPIAGATVEWTATSQGAQLVAPWLLTDEAGEARTGWVLGTDAGEVQQLQVAVLLPGTEARATIQARSVPHVVSELRVVLDTPAVLRLGDTLPVRLNAVDPYGNVFPAPDVSVALEDSTVGLPAGSGVIGARRGRTLVHATSQGVSAEFPLHVTQYVGAIAPTLDTMSFTAVGAELPILYTVRDDRGRLVADTAAAIAIGDTTKVAVTGGTVRSLASGATELHLAIGSATATIVVGVRQRLASLALVRDSLRFDALLDTARIRLIARDSLNSPIPRPGLSYTVSDERVAKFVSGRTLTAIAPGVAVVTVRDSVTGISVSADVVVRQRVASITLPMAQLRFDAIADTAGIGVATARDRLGSVVTGAPLDYAVSDSTIAALLPDGRVRSVGPGQALLTARDSESGVTGQAVVVVDQVATALTVAVDSGKPIVTLPVGATLPLACQAFDRNGFAIVQHAMLVGSVRGTVTGGGCGDARIAHSGYDTLVFTLGAVQTRAPVIVSTGDSVSLAGASHALNLSNGFTSIVQPLDPRITFVGEDLANPLILALRPLVNDILAAYGNPTSNLDRARAIRDWVARTAVYPDAAVHPNGSTSGLSVLPVGKTWADVNRILTLAKWNEDASYWSGQYYDGYTMLDRLLGTLDLATGIRADDGMMEQVAGAQYRIKDIASYRYPLCTYQAIIANAVWAAAGLQSLRLTTLEHDPAAVFIPELGRWVYEDPTFDEEYLLDGTGDPLSPVDLLLLSTNGQVSRLKPTKLTGPRFDPQSYIDGRSYLTVIREGMGIMGSQLYGRTAGQHGNWSGRYVQIDVPRLATVPAPVGDPLVFQRVAANVAFPIIGVGVEQLAVDDSVYVATLASTLPSHDHFERRTNSGLWGRVTTPDVLPVGACRVEYRSVDAIGNISASAVLDLWIPRAEGFLQSGVQGGTRGRAQDCM